MYSSFVTDDQKELELKIFQELSTQKAYEFIKEQIKIGERLSGTHEGLKEVKLIKETLERYDIPSELFEFNANLSLPIESTFRVISPKKMNIDCTPLSFSSDTPPGGLEGELIFLGYGKEEDYQDKNVSGKIVLVSLGGGISRQRKTAICMSKSPKALVVFTNLSNGSIQKGTCKTVVGNPAPEFIGPSYVPDIPVIAINNKNGLDLVDMCKEGKIKVWLKTKVTRGWEKAYHLVASIGGTVEPEKFVLLGGHYDSFGPVGVLCNAMGIAAMVEFARAFNKFKDQLRRSIRFVFLGAHECALGAGGVWYIDNYWDDIQDNLMLYSFMGELGIKDPTLLISRITPEIQLFYKDLIKEVGLPSYIKAARFGIPTGGADIASFPLYANVSTIRDFASRDYGKIIERADVLHTAEDNMDLASPNMFETAFRTMTPAFLRFCNMPILPIEFSICADQFLNGLSVLKKEGNNIIDLRLAIKYAEKFKDEYTHLYWIGNRMLNVFKTKDEQNQERSRELFKVINDTLLRVTRKTNRILLSGFYKWDRYTPGLYVNDADPEVQEPKMIPILEPIKKLSMLDDKSDEYWALLTKMVRERNKVSDELKESIEIIKSAIREIE